MAAFSTGVGDGFAAFSTGMVWGVGVVSAFFSFTGGIIIFLGLTTPSALATLSATLIPLTVNLNPKSVFAAM